MKRRRKRRANGPPPAPDVSDALDALFSTLDAVPELAGSVADRFEAVAGLLAEAPDLLGPVVEILGAVPDLSSPRALRGAEVPPRRDEASPLFGVPPAR